MCGALHSKELRMYGESTAARQGAPAHLGSVGTYLARTRKWRAWGAGLGNWGRPGRGGRSGPAWGGTPARPGVAPLPGLGGPAPAAWVGPPQPGGAAPAGGGRPTLGWAGPSLGRPGVPGVLRPPRPPRPPRVRRLLPCAGCAGCGGRGRRSGWPARCAGLQRHLGRRSTSTSRRAPRELRALAPRPRGGRKRVGFVAARPDDTRQSTCRARRADAQLWQCQVAGACTPRTPEQSAILRPHSPRPPPRARGASDCTVALEGRAAAAPISVCRVRADCPIRSTVAGQHPSSHRWLSERLRSSEARAQGHDLL